MKDFHLVLIKYRVLYTAVTVFFIFLGWDAWGWFKQNHQALEEWSVAGFVSIYMAIIGALKFALENARRNNEYDQT